MNIKIPNKDTEIPIISIILLIKKNKYWISSFLYPYTKNRIYHFVSSNFFVKIKIIMKVSILGNGLTSLTLAKMLVNEGINWVFSDGKIKKLIRFKL